jgi:hypothetical protein
MEKKHHFNEILWYNFNLIMKVLHLKPKPPTPFRKDLS